MSQFIATVPPASETQAGTLSAADKTKLDGLPAGDETANVVYAGPTGGSAAVPAFRTLVAADIPAIGQSQVSGLSGALSTLSTDVAAITAAYGQVSGLATLDGSGHLTAAQVPAALVGAVVYQGTWNAATNSPTLASGVGTKGFYYVVSTAGSTSIDGISTWNAGDAIIYSGTAWDKIDGVSSQVLSFNGQTGAVVLSAGSGLSLSGSTISVTAGTYSPLAGSSSIASVGVITTGTWQGTPIAASYVGNLPASQITSGQLSLAQGGTGANLSSTGGAGNYLKQTTSGGAVSVGAIASGDLPSAVQTAATAVAGATNANTASALVQRDSNGSAAFDVVTATHLETDNSVTPTVTLGAGAGTGATYSIAGTDNLLVLTVTTGSSTASNSTFATVTFGKAFAQAPQVAIFPQGSPAWGLASGKQPTITSVTTTGFTIETGPGAPTGDAILTFALIVIG